MPKGNLPVLPEEQQRRDEALRAELLTYALAGDRCPSNAVLRARHVHVELALKNLTRAGVLTVEVYGKNFRVIRFATGEATMPPPSGSSRPARVVGQNGQVWRPEPKAPAAKREPRGGWLP